MAEGRRGLGRGLSALLNEVQAASTPEARQAAGVREVAIESVQPNPGQPRKRFGEDELAELSESIRERGVLQPILVRPAADQAGTFQIVAGERRWRAAQRAGLATLPVLVRDLSDQAVMEVALIENLQRADLDALEEAAAYEALIDRFHAGAESVAKVVGKSRSHVANTLRLMKLPEGVKGHLRSGAISAGHARALLDAPGAEALAERIAREGLSVRQTEALARGAKDKATGVKGKGGRSGLKDTDTRALEADLEDRLGLPVEVRDRGGAGEIRLTYRTLEQLDEICRRLTRGGGF